MADPEVVSVSVSFVRFTLPHEVDAVTIWSIWQLLLWIVLFNQRSFLFSPGLDKHKT